MMNLNYLPKNIINKYEDMFGDDQEDLNNILPQWTQECPIDRGPFLFLIRNREWDCNRRYLTEYRDTSLTIDYNRTYISIYVEEALIECFLFKEKPNLMNINSPIGRMAFIDSWIYLKFKMNYQDRYDPIIEFLAFIFRGC